MKFSVSLSGHKSRLPDRCCFFVLAASESICLGSDHDMSSDTKISTRTDLNQHHQRHYYHHDKTPVSEFDYDECSVDSGCSNSSTGSSLSHRNSDEQSDRPSRSRKVHCYLERLQTIDRSTWSQDRDGNAKKSSQLAWNMEDVRSPSRSSISSPRYSFSPSDVHDSDGGDPANKYSTMEMLKRAFQSLKISSIKWNDQERKNAKKSPKRILRSPVSYTYVRGLSGLPTQRVPRNAVLQRKHSCSYQDLIRFNL